MSSLFKYLLILLPLITISCGEGGKGPKSYWPFDEVENEVTVEKQSGKWFPVSTNAPVPEYVKGVKGEALRLDGYSSYITGALPAKLEESFLLQGWFALETFPTDTAGFFTLKDQTGENWIMAGLNQFGNPIIGVCRNGEQVFVGNDAELEKFSWLRVSLKVDGQKAFLEINGEEMVAAELEMPSAELDHFVLGQGARPEYLVDRFIVNRINGLVDEVKLWSPAPAEVPAVSVNPQKPDLVVPESRFANDFNRPEYHILPAANWTNETHGLIGHNGTYHIFNQKNGTNLFLGQINWGHFSSKDLVSWTEHKPAITPGPDYDRNGIWSGHAIKNHEGEPVIMYTGSDGNEFGMCLALPEDEQLIEWEKFSGNPVVQGVPEGFERKDFRDPFIWKEDSVYYMMVGFGVVENDTEKGALLLYKSRDFKDWEYLHLLFKGNPEVDDSGVFWEMSTFWKFGDKYVLVVNKVPHNGEPARALYWTGQFQNEKFVPDYEVPKRLEVVNRFLSPSLMRLENGKTVAIGIIPDETSYKAQLEQGWTHLFSFTREWEFKNGKICQKPFAGIEKLRAESEAIEPQKLTNEKIKLTSGHQKELILNLLPEDCAQFGLVIGEHPEGVEKTPVVFDLENQKVMVDRRQSSERAFIPLDTREGAYEMEHGKPLKLHVLIDGSVIEFFINDEDAFSTRIFPLYSESCEVSLFSKGGTIDVLNGEINDLKSSQNQTDW